MLSGCKVTMKTYGCTRSTGRSRLESILILLLAPLGALSRLRMETSQVESAHERVCIANPQEMLPGIAHVPQLMVHLLGLIQPTEHLIQDRVEGDMVIERCHGSSSLISYKRYWRSSLKILIPWNRFKAGNP